MQVSSQVYWLALCRVRGVGPRVARLLLKHFGSAPAVFAASETQLSGAGIPRNTARNLRQFQDFAPLERELCDLVGLGGRLITWADPDYPPNLAQLPDPPPVLYVRGSMPVGERDCVAVVGARAASEAGRHMARRLGLELAAKGIAVVSGLARGIDSEAHLGALEAHGRTIAVLGCGVDRIYPLEHSKLAQEMIAGGGALLSEFPLGSPPLAENFPVRNRIIAGLSLGVVVVEAAEHSGSLISAHLALEQNRQVFAVPGSPLSGKARGSNRLLKEGARLVECVEDVIEELAPQLSGAAGRAVPSTSSTKAQVGQQARRAELSASLRSVVDHLPAGERVHIDAIVESCGLNAQTVLSLLLELELTGMVVQHPGKLFSLAPAASA
ncbi:MAG TPA: DNA-processing protein DprA [Candidatus Binataceae bacterium]|nr:DNA-processing protein DprA [Candidatus Binataceae bacterium]